MKGERCVEPNNLTGFLSVGIQVVSVVLPVELLETTWYTRDTGHGNVGEVPVASTNTKSKDKRPARARYWNSGKLAERKIRNLVRCCKVKPEEAKFLWLKVRKRHYSGHTGSKSLITA